MNEFFKIDKRILDASDKALKLCKEQFKNIEKITEYNQQKVQLITEYPKHILVQAQDTDTEILAGKRLIRFGRRFWVQNLHLCAITLLAERIHLQLHFSGF